MEAGMANGSKSIWVMTVLLAAGMVLFILSTQNKQGSSRDVVLQEVFKQQPAQVQPTPPAAAELEKMKVKDPVTSPAIVTSPENGHEAGFAVQVYSFQDRMRAEKALSNLKGLGYKAFMEASDLGGKGTWYRIRIGGLETESQAKTMLEEVRKNFNSGFIVNPK